MDIGGLLVFAAVFGVACASPGPTIVALVARVIGKGTGGTPFFCLGLLLGDLMWLACAVLGLAALAEVFHPIFLVIKYLGAAYLLYLGWKLWTLPSTPPLNTELAKDPDDQPIVGIASSLTLTLGNPKTMLFYIALLPTVVVLTNLSWLGFAELGGVVVVIYSLVLSSYVAFAARSRRLIGNKRAMRMVNRASGTIMAGAAIAVVTRN